MGDGSGRRKRETEVGETVLLWPKNGFPHTPIQESRKGKVDGRVGNFCSLENDGERELGEAEAEESILVAKERFPPHPHPKEP